MSSIAPKSCSIEGCLKQYYATGYCRMHYQRKRKHGDPVFTLMGERHNMSNTPEFHAWTEMRRRCRTTNRKGSKHYSLRGITVCDKWQDSFLNFYTDMGKRPSPKHTLERQDVNGNYEPSNCVWATYKEQANNRTNNYMITINGITKNARQWADEYGIPDTTFWNRIKRGWTGEKLIQDQKQRLNLIEINDEIKSLAQWSKDTGIPESTIRNRINRGCSMNKILTKK